MKNVNEKTPQRILFVMALSSISILILMTVFILIQGLPIISKVGFMNFVFGMRWAPGKGEFGIFPMIIGTLTVTLGAAVLGIPVGICVSIFLTEFAPLKLRSFFRSMIQLLAGIPSVVYGFWGLLFVVPLIRNYLGGPGLSILAGSIILAIMILPTVVSISENAISSVPHEYREASYAIGANKRETATHVLIPAAKSGILASVILGMGRAIGETMAVLMITGNVALLPQSILDPVATLTGTIALEMGYADATHQQALFAVGIVLFCIIFILNIVARFVVSRMGAGGK